MTVGVKQWKASERRIVIERRALSLKEACQKIGVSKPKLYQLIGERKFPSFHIGRKHYVLSTALDEFMERMKEIEV